MPEETEEGLRGLWNSSATFADLGKRLYLPRLAAALAEIAPARKEAILTRFARRFDPWPEWVLNIGVEILKVYLPTIEKPALRSLVKCVHALFFELRLDDTTPPGTIPAPQLDTEILGALWGHMTAFSEDCHKKVVQLADEGVITPEKSVEFEKRVEPPPHVNEAFAYYVNARGVTDLAKVAEAMAKAKGKTFDEQGGLKETSATKIYRAIFADWPDVESLAGPTELCNFLMPVLQGSRNDPELKLDRVKKICMRMGIVFRPAGKGQSYPLALSLPDTD
jgi:hypothetical protein